MRTSRVLVATDLSETSALALREAHARAACGGVLLVCHILPSWPRDNAVLPHTTIPADEDLATRRRQAAEAVTMFVAEATGRGPDDYSMSVDSGDPAGTVVRRADEWKADLIVVGSFGVTALSRMRLGSVAEQVLRLASCPVLVVRPRRGSGVILAGTDFSDAARPALEAAAGEARRTGGRVTYLHSVEWRCVGDAQIAGGAIVARHLPNDPADRARTRLEASLRQYAVDGECRVVYGKAGRALVREAEADGADLLVIGTHGRSGISRPMLGSVADFVVRTAPCSVLVVPLGGGV